MEMKAVFVFLSLLHLNSGFYRKHFLVGDSMTWSNAQTYCRKHHLDLSTADFSELMLFSANSKLKNNFYWIGLHRDAEKPSVWRWSGGEEATDVTWAIGQPDTLHEQCAVILKSNSKAYDTPCITSLPFFCMENFELILVQQGHTWYEALEYCRLNYMNLAGLTSDVTMAEAANKSANALTLDLWVGLRFIAGHWFWLHENNKAYKGWDAEGELQCPALDQRCGVYDRKRAVWKPANCAQRLNFLCVRKFI